MGGSDGRLYALKPDGTALWSNPPNLGNTVDSPPVIAPDGTLYAGRNGGGSESDYSGILYAVNTTAFGVANTAWPMDGQNPLRVQRAVGFPQCTEPVITLQPVNTAIMAGEAVKLTAEATGTDLSFQWYEGADRSKPVGTGTSFVTPDLDKTTSYWVQVSNTCGSVNSLAAIVTVNSPVVNPKFSTLADVKINDQSIKDFSSTIFDYAIVLPSGTVKIPVITAYTAVVGAEVEVINTGNLPGSTIVNVISPDGVSKQTYTFHFTVSTGFAENEKNDEFTIYPNPATERLFLDLPLKNIIYGVRIKSVNGQTVYLNSSFTESYIDVSGLSPGVYIISLTYGQETTVKQFIRSGNRY